jgi:hypothetical protein
MAVWKWFQLTHSSSGSLEPLYDMLNEIWQEDRKTCTQDQLAAYAAAWASGVVDIGKDWQFQAFLLEMDRAFSKKKKPE